MSREGYLRNSDIARWYCAIWLVVLGAAVQADINGRVVKVTDGDTVTVLDSGNVQHTVRLTGIDAPERGQPFGSASRRHLASLVAGKQVHVQSDMSDRYGRALGKILLDGQDMNVAQIRAGMAWWYRYYADTQPEADRKAYEAAEDAAKAAGLGLWSEPNPITPYDWRKEKGRGHLITQEQ